MAVYNSREKDTHTVYALRCKENGKVYIGCTSNFKTRMEGHMRDLGNNKSSVLRLREDAEKYGKDGFEIYILEENLAYKEARMAEGEYISLYKSNNPKFGYNINSSGYYEVSFNVTPGKPPLHDDLDSRPRQADGA